MNNSEVIKTIDDFSKSNSLFDCDNLIVGLSGGPDSVGLLLILCELKNKYGDSFPKIMAVHVNHNLRGEDADNDEAFCQRLCDSQGVLFESFTFDIKDEALRNKKSLEEMGRIRRYEVFNQIAYSKNNSRIALAHHKDDVAETMLMNLFRGAGIEGLTSPRAINGNLIRPLLCLSKDDIISYLEKKHVSYCFDKTNSISDTTRNKWRNEIIPSISEVSIKKPSDALKDTYDLLSEDLKLIDELILDRFNQNTRCFDGLIMLSVKNFNEMSYALKSRLIRKLWSVIFGNLTDFAKIHVDSVIGFIASSNSGTGQLDMPFSRSLIKVNGEITFSKKGEEISVLSRIAKNMGFALVTSSVKEEISFSKTTNFPNTSIHIEANIVENNVGLEYNNLSWYFPIDGEFSGLKMFFSNEISSFVFQKAGSSSRKNLVEYLKDAHVPKDVRRFVSGILIDDKLAFVPGVGHQNGFTSEASYSAWKKSHPNYEGRFLQIIIKNEGCL